MYVYCSNGDHLITRKKEPVDSPAAVEAMLEWMSSSYDVKRMYWRGAGEQLWDMSMKYGKETANIYDWVQWRRHTFQQGTTQAAVSAAKKFGMDIFMYTSLFDYGVQPDIGIIGPYLFEDRKRIERPDWCMIDRWGERRCPGPYEFAYPEARQFVIRRFVDYVTEHHFDGINFYTYVENCGMRYVDEFGFSEPVVQLFRERYPDTDLRRDRLTEEQKRHWYACRGTFVTDFVRELHAELAVRGKKLSIILDANDPDYTQPWWSRSVPGMGFIRMDWQQWVKEGIVDELWVQLDAVASQTATLDRLLGICSGTAVKLTFRTPNPFDPVWEPYREAGVTPVTVITSPVNGIERLSATLPTSDHLASGSWIERAQSLADMADGRISANPQAAAALAADSHLLVRQRVMRALRAIGTTEQLSAVYARLDDAENCVRVAAAEALGRLYDSGTPVRLLAAIERDGTLLMKQSCIDSLVEIGEQSFHDVAAGLSNEHAAVREVCVRALKGLGEIGGLEVYTRLSDVMRETREDETVRYWAIDGLRQLAEGGKLSRAEVSAYIDGLAHIADAETSTVVQLQAVKALGQLAETIGADLISAVAAGKVEALFRQYGDGCTRTDAAFGWRVAGNTLLALGEAGSAILERMLAQKRDKWLAWLAYEVVYLPHTKPAFDLCEEEQMIADHDRYAPVFPGYRSW